MSAVRGRCLTARSRVTYAVPGSSAVVHSGRDDAARRARRQRRAVAAVALAVAMAAALVLAVALAG